MNITGTARGTTYANLIKDAESQVKNFFKAGAEWTINIQDVHAEVNREPTWGNPLETTWTEYSADFIAEDDSVIKDERTQL